MQVQWLAQERVCRYVAMADHRTPTSCYPRQAGKSSGKPKLLWKDARLREDLEPLLIEDRHFFRADQWA